MKRRWSSILQLLTLSGATALIGVAVVQGTISLAQQTTQPVLPQGPEEVARLMTLGNRGARVHDPSTIVKDKDDYWVFYTGRGVPSWRSKDLVKWEAGPAVFPQPPAWVAQTIPGNRNSFWAPDVMRAGDKFLLYYSVSTFGSRNSVIAVASNPTLDPADPKYKWTDGGVVLQSTDQMNYNTIDPSIVRDFDNNLWLSFGSFWSGIKLVQLNPETGQRITPDSPIYSLAHFSSIEASYIYPHDKKYYLFVNWGRCCRGASSTYEIRVGRSDKITGPYLDKDGKDLLKDGGTQLLKSDGSFVGPGHAGIYQDGDKYWLSMHFYNGTTARGTSMLAIRPLHWDADGWPVVDAK